MSNRNLTDLHCHISLKPFHGDLNLQKLKTICDQIKNPIEGNPAKIVFNLLSSMDKNLWVALESQSSAQFLIEGNFSVACNALYPLERGFCNPDLHIFESLVRMFDKNFPEKDSDKLKFKKAIASIIGISQDVVTYIGEQNTDYFHRLQEENNYLDDQQKNAQCKFQICNNYKEVQDANTNGKLAIINSIEGCHSFGSGLPSTESISQTELTSHLISNIEKMKAWANHPMYITINHHFYNQLSGHARSFNSPLSTILNQENGKNTGITEAGKAVIRKLLSPEYGKSPAKRRMIVDIKHMSAQSRSEYFQMLDQEYSGQKIPIICSHTGITQWSTLNDMQHSIEDNNRTNRGLWISNWSINLCKEEIDRITLSEGLIGIQLDEKRISGKDAQQEIGKAKRKFYNGPDRPSEWEVVKNLYFKLLAENIFQAIRHAKDREATWQTLTLGSDNDGVVNPLDIYKNAKELKNFPDEFENYLNINNSEYSQYKPASKTWTDIVDMLTHKNFNTFLSRNFI